MELSIVIPYHNEGVDFISTTLVNIIETIDIESYEIIVVDDHSDIPLENIRGIKLIRHTENKGVGAAFDTGVAVAKSKNLFLMGCDVRFLPNNWATMMLMEIKDHPQSFTCTSCVGIREGKMDIEERQKEGSYNGATILAYHDQESNPRVDNTFRQILEAKWLPSIKNKHVPSFEIPCILGAAYGVSKQWYNYIDGWAGHKLWGTLEPYISLKSWFFGGSCRVAPKIFTAHVFKPSGVHGTPQDIIMYNKMFVAHVLLDEFDRDRLINFFGNDPAVERAKYMILDNIEYIREKRDQYIAKTTINKTEFFNRWNIDMRTDRVVNELSKEYDYIYSKPEKHYQKHYSQSPYYKVWKKLLDYIDHDDSVIDLGCGPGQLMHLLCDHGIKNYLGYEFSHTAIAMADSKIKEFNLTNAKVQYLDLSIENLSYEDADVYVAVEVFEHLDNDMYALEHVPPGKKVIITVPNYLGGSHVRKFDNEEEVAYRYGMEMKCLEVTEIKYGSGKIFVLYGIKD